MTITCDACVAIYDDARCTTICPHEPFLTVEEAERKDAATALIGKAIVFAHQPNGPTHRVQSIGFTGMVTLYGMAGEFSPHLFMVP